MSNPKRQAYKSMGYGSSVLRSRSHAGISRHIQGTFGVLDSFFSKGPGGATENERRTTLYPSPSEFARPKKAFTQCESINQGETL